MGKLVFSRGLGLSHLWIQKCGRCENLLELFGDLKDLQNRKQNKKNVGEDGLGLEDFLVIYSYTGNSLNTMDTIYIYIYISI